MIYPRADVNRSLPGPEQYGSRYDSLLGAIKIDLEDLERRRYLPSARRLRDLTGDHFNDTAYPMYFVGDLDAPFVLVHLNAQQGDLQAERYEGEFVPFEDYFRIHRYFGWHHYGPEAPRTHRSPFDQKQIEFLRPFEVIDFTGDPFTDLERVIDHKLQMEFIPYGSRTFRPKGFDDAATAPHIDRLFEVLFASPRTVVVFCGTVFEAPLKQFAIDDHRFRLTKSDGTETKGTYRFANLRIPHEGGTLSAGLAHTFPIQGLTGKLMYSYGRECASRYKPGS